MGNANYARGFSASSANSAPPDSQDWRQALRCGVALAGSSTTGGNRRSEAGLRLHRYAAYLLSFSHHGSIWIVTRDKLADTSANCAAAGTLRRSTFGIDTRTTWATWGNADTTLSHRPRRQQRYCRQRTDVAIAGAGAKETRATSPMSKASARAQRRNEFANTITSSTRYLR